MFKRFIDIIIAMVGLLLFLPLLLVICFCLKISNGRPIFIKDIRIGKNQKLIHLYRFQIYRNYKSTQKSQADTNAKASFTRFGKILHFFGMDGLPLLVNVLRGDLSLVGPPPEMPGNVRFYTKEQKVVFSILICSLKASWRRES